MNSVLLSIGDGRLAGSRNGVAAAGALRLRGSYSLISKSSGSSSTSSIRAWRDMVGGARVGGLNCVWR